MDSWISGNKEEKSQKLDLVNQENQALEQKLSEAQAQNKQLANELQELVRENNQELKELRSIIQKDYQNSLAELKGQVQQLQTEKNDLQKELVSKEEYLTKKLEVLEVKHSSLKGKEKERIQKEIAELKQITNSPQIKVITAMQYTTEVRVETNVDQQPEADLGFFAKIGRDIGRGLDAAKICLCEKQEIICEILSKPLKRQLEGFCFVW